MQGDPHVMYILVRDESDAQHAAEDACLAARVMLENMNPEDPDLLAWTEGAYRKVTLRVKESAWDEICSRDDVSCVRSVCVTRPMRKSARDKTLKRLQTLKTLPHNLLEWNAVSTPQENTIDIGINLSLGMSMGKIIAQAAHAATHAPGDSSWRINVWGISDWETSILKLPRTSLLIHDAGFTEIERGSQTAWAQWS